MPQFSRIPSRREDSCPAASSVSSWVDDQSVLTLSPNDSVSNISRATISTTARNHERQRTLDRLASHDRDRGSHASRLTARSDLNRDRRPPVSFFNGSQGRKCERSIERSMREMSMNDKVKSQIPNGAARIGSLADTEVLRRNEASRTHTGSSCQIRASDQGEIRPVAFVSSPSIHSADSCSSYSNTSGESARPYTSSHMRSNQSHHSHHDDREDLHSHRSSSRSRTSSYSRNLPHSTRQHEPEIRSDIASRARAASISGRSYHPSSFADSSQHARYQLASNSDLYTDSSKIPTSAPHNGSHFCPESSITDGVPGNGSLSSAQRYHELDSNFHHSDFLPAYDTFLGVGYDSPFNPSKDCIVSDQKRQESECLISGHFDDERTMIAGQYCASMNERRRPHGSRSPHQPSSHTPRRRVTKCLGQPWCFAGLCGVNQGLRDKHR